MRTAIQYSLVIGCLALPLAAAAERAHPRGADLGFAGAGYTDSGIFATRNPAAEVAEGGRGVRMGIFGLGVGYEFGDVSDFGDRFEQVGDDADELSKMVGNLGELDDVQDILDVIDQIGTTEESINELLDAIAEEGYFALSVEGHPPPFPLSITQDALRGSLTVDLNFSFRGHVSVLHKGRIATGFADIPTDLDTFQDDGWSYDGTNIIDPDGETIELDAEFSLDESGGYVQSAQNRTFSLGYGTGVLVRRAGVLYAGARLNHHTVELSRAAAFFDDDAEDTLSDRYNDNLRESNDVGVDLGMVWHGPGYRLGATVYNLVEPSFDYADIGVDCDAGDRNCELLDEYAEAGFVERGKTYTMERQLTLEGAYHHRGGRWMAGLSVDANAVEGPFGENFDDEHQWMALAGALRTRSAWAPQARLGLRHNAAGSELTFVTAGVTFFRGLHLDAAASTERVDSVPRAMQLNLSAEAAF